MWPLRGSETHGPWPQASYKLTLGPADNHDIISMKLFQLMVEHTPEEENIDWTKIEPSVNFLKSPKGMFAVPPSLGLCRTGAGPGPALVPAYGPSAFAGSGCAVAWALGLASHANEQCVGTGVCWDNDR